MNEPSAQSCPQQQQQRDRLQQKVQLIDAAWERSERILDILRHKRASSEPITPEERMQWAKQLRIVA